MSFFFLLNPSLDIKATKNIRWFVKYQGGHLKCPLYMNTPNNFVNQCSYSISFCLPTSNSLIFAATDEFIWNSQDRRTVQLLKTRHKFSFFPLLPKPRDVLKRKFEFGCLFHWVLDAPGWGSMNIWWHHLTL